MGSERCEEREGSASRLTRVWLGFELATFFLLGPAIYVALDPGPGAMFPALWIWFAVCITLLLTDRSFARRELWNFGGLRAELVPILKRFAVLGGALTLVTALLIPDTFLYLPRERPVLWLMIMILYPLFSVYPQEVIFRPFFFHRYKAILPAAPAMLGASALTFGWVHIIFGHWLSVVLTIFGGAIFAYTFARSRSVLAAIVDHALYGCLVFTIGLGRFFYAGAAGS